jgi:hypothetical protein
MDMLMTRAGGVAYKHLLEYTNIPLEEQASSSITTL